MNKNMFFGACDIEGQSPPLLWGPSFQFHTAYFQRALKIVILLAHFSSRVIFSPNRSLPLPPQTVRQRTAPLQSRAPGGLARGRRGLVGMGAAGRGPGSLAGTSTTGGAGRGGARSKSKMKTVHFAEVKGLTEEHKKRSVKITADESREAKRKRIREEATARGMRVKKKPEAAEAGKGSEPKSGAEGNQNKDGTGGPEGVSNAEQREVMDSAGMTALSQMAAAGAWSQGEPPTGGGISSSLEGLPQMPMAPLAPEVAMGDFSSMGAPALIHNDALGNDADLVAMALSAYQQQEHVVPLVDPLSAVHQHSTDPSSFDAAMSLTGLMAAPYGDGAMHGDPIPAAAPYSVEPSTPVDVQQSWRQLLDKSNKLSSEDRFRVEQFFNDRFNPTPGVMVYKMKLNEEKTLDPETGQIVKETLYLELDYDTFGCKQLRKIKKK